MADNGMKLSKDDKNEKMLNADLPPPPDSAQHSVTGTQEESFMPPPPPPKESFSKFYEQRQVNELKRLYRHMHPELRKNLEHVVTKDISELLSNDEHNPQGLVHLDAVLPGEVQSMRWIFENWNLDTIGEHTSSRKLTEEEAVLGGNVKNTSLKFQGQTCIDSNRMAPSMPEKDQTKGDVKTALWLFETQPLHSLNKIYPEDTEVQEAVLKEPIEKGDVKATKTLFETQSLDEVGRCNSIEEHSILQLKSEIQELKGDVNKTIKLFQTEPLCAIRDNNGNIHEIKSVCREETQSNSVNTARWLFETQPLDTIHKDTSNVKIIRGISLEEIAKGGVNAAKWVFETQPLDTIKEHIDDGVFQASMDTTHGADVSKHSNTYENQSVGSTTIGKITNEDIVAGDVKSTLWLFETQPMETLKGTVEVGQLQKVELLNEEKGDVKQRKHIFETCSLDQMSNKEEESRDQYGLDAKEIIKGDVKSFKNLFETLPLDSIKSKSSVQVFNQDDIKSGNVKASQVLFETTPLYAIEDSLGNYHEVTSVSREQIISGDVKNYKWMFETKPLDQCNEGVQKVDIIKGITKQEIVSGDVATAKWLFETQPVDVIHQAKNEQCTTPKEVLQKGDVKKCRWLFETQPMDRLYDKSEKTDVKETLGHSNVKSYTWMFETQPLDSIRDSEEQHIKMCMVSQDNLESVNVKTTKHLFETEPLDSISSTSELRKMIRYSSKVEIQSGEVSRMKEVFETKPDSLPQVKANIPTEGNIQAGSVNKFTWLFENCPMDSMRKDSFQELPPENDIQGGDVGNKKFIFETYSLDQIHQDSEMKDVTKDQEAVTRGDVKSCTMLFESKPLYAIQDKGGEYHEVTSVKKEEIQKGDVSGAKWLFETKPLDRINKDEEVFVIRAVTQEDIEKGCVKAARWRFETEPLDSITDITKNIGRTIDDIQKGDIQHNKQLFESQQVNQKKYIRLVSVSDVQKGNVRTSTWLFENQPINSLKGEDQEHCGIIKVQREDNQKGDVKRCTWLFESQPLDSLKDAETPTALQTIEDIPKANVKSTTWLFESTPLDKFDIKQSSSTEQREINVNNIIDAFISCKIIQHAGIVIENINGRSVNMIKYQLSTHATTEIQKEEMVAGNLQRILLQLLHRTDVEPQGLLVEEDANEQLHVTKLNLLNPTQTLKQEQEYVSDDTSNALKILLNENNILKTGIIMEECERGSVKIIIYALSSHCKFNVTEEDVVKGDIKSTIGNLLACSQESKPKLSVNREQNEKGNVQLYTSCIEKGNLQYLRSLQAESEIEALTLSQSEPRHEELSSEQPTVSNVRNTSSECVPVVSNPFTAVKENVVGDNMKDTNSQNASLGCKMQKETLASSNTIQSSTALQKSQAIKHTTEEKNSSTVSKKGSYSTSVQSSCASNSDLQAALLDLKQVTAEAKSIQQQAQSKIQKSAQDIQLSNSSQQVNIVRPVQATLHQEKCDSKHTASVMTKVQESQSSYASLQKSTSCTKKVSVEEGAAMQYADTSAESSSLKDDLETHKQAKSYLNPFVECEYKTQLEQEERDQDIVRGDVKAAIRALQYAVTEQKDREKEEVVRGNLTSTLQSLQKSNVNVSKGDFKAAMIYRNAGQSCAPCKRTSDVQQCKDQDMVKSVHSSDNASPPSPAAVPGQERSQPLNASHLQAPKDDSANVKDPTPNIPGLTAQASEDTLDNASTQMSQRKKPALPPKPKHLPPVVRPPPRHKVKTPLSSPSSSSMSNDERACTTVPDMSIPVQSASQDTTNLASIYTSARTTVESEKVVISSTQATCREQHVLTSKFQDNQEECTFKDTDMLSKSNTTATKDLNSCTPKQVEQISEDHLCKPLLCLKSNNKQESPKRKSGVTITESRDSPVIMRVKHKRETEDERRNRLSIHRDEIMKDNVQAATHIFDHLRKQDELKMILKQVKELEEETKNVDVKSMRGLFENVPDWVVSSDKKINPLPKRKESHKEDNFELRKEDTESVSSMDLAYEDLEKASAEIRHLKEQTLSRLLEIEEAIKKALLSVSNLKSDSDIASLSSLFRESLGTSTTSNNIRKISIVSSKIKPEKTVQLFEQKSNDTSLEIKKTELEVTNTSSRLSPTSPSFITIESAARKPTQQNGNCVSSAVISNQNDHLSQNVLSLHKESISGNLDKGLNLHDCSDPFNQWNMSGENSQCASAGLLGLDTLHEQNAQLNLHSPSSPNSQRQKSVLQLKTGLDSPKVIGTTIVTEKYEESDQYGNKTIRSKTSTTVTKQSDTQSSSTFEFVSAPPRYEVTASPLLRRHVMSSADNCSNKNNETGVVFVTFGNSKQVQK